MSMIRIQEILDLVSSYSPNADLELIQRAYVFSAAAHAGQTRLSGEPYLMHPLAVAHYLAEMRLDEASIAAGLLHDTVEDTHATIEDIDAQFGEEVADIVDGVTKISLMTFDSKEEAQAENIRKMLLSMAEDMRVLIVKLADRMHNMSTLDFQKPHKQQRIAQETMDIYVPLANRLGLHRIKLKLEDLSLHYLKPDIWSQLTEWLEKKRIGGSSYIDNVISILEDMLADNDIKGIVKGRLKHIYSIYHKMEQQGLTIDEVPDVIAFRVIVDDVKSCYAVLGLAHANWKPVHGRFKDYISMPKRNGYQSLHTTVIGPGGERIEIQIRTQEMDNLAEHGVASHWLYKEGRSVRAEDIRQFSWLRDMLDWQKSETDSREFIRTLKFDLFKEEVYVFTPRGEVKELPEDASPVDFAYMIHTKVGDHCTGAKVNGRMVPLATKLQNGDTVEIITDPNRHPSRDWLKFIKTAKARTRINNYIRTEERARSISLGREMLEKQGRRVGVNVTKLVKEGGLDELVLEMGVRDVDELFSQVGYSRITPNKLLRKLMPKEEQEKTVEAPSSSPATKTPEQSRKEGVSIKGMDDMLVRFGKCCNPVPGDAIVGYISRGRGVTVHTADCSNVKDLEPERLLSVSWDGTDGKPYPARINLLCENHVGDLAQVSALLAKEDVNIDAASLKSNIDGKGEMDFTIRVRDSAHLYRIIDQLRQLKSVLQVIRSAAQV